jgi:hypothetical protein
MLEMHGWVNIRDSFDPHEELDSDICETAQFLKIKMGECTINGEYVKFNIQNGSLYICITAFDVDNHLCDAILLFLEYISHSYPGSYGLIYVSNSVLGEFQVYSLKKGVLATHNESLCLL